MRLTAAIVRARDCHCPFKQIDHRPAGRSIEQSAQRKGRKMASPCTGRCGGKTLASEIPLLSYYETFPRIVNLFPRIGRSHARTNKQSRTKHALIVSRETLQNTALYPEKGWLKREHFVVQNCFLIFERPSATTAICAFTVNRVFPSKNGPTKSTLLYKANENKRVEREVCIPSIIW